MPIPGCTHLEILKEVPYSRLDVQRVQPKGEYPSFPLSLCIKVFNLWRCFSLFERCKSWPIVEQVGDERQVQFWVSSNERVSGQESSTTNLVGVLEDLFSSLMEVGSLKWGFRALIGFKLVQEDSIVLSIRDIPCKVLDPTS